MIQGVVHKETECVRQDEGVNGRGSPRWEIREIDEDGSGSQEDEKTKRWQQGSVDGRWRYQNVKM